MTARLTPGKRLRRALDAALRERGMEWTESDVALTLPLIEATADRVEMLRGKLDAEAEQPQLSLRGVQIAAELRQAEAQLTRLVASLGLDGADDDEPAPKSARHAAAAATRWDRRSHRRVAA
jgi:hypothetical protein